MKLGDLQGGTEARIGGIFADRVIAAQQGVRAGPVEVGEAKTAVQRQPTGQLVLVFEEQSLHATPKNLAPGRHGLRSIA